MDGQSKMRGIFMLRQEKSLLKSLGGRYGSREMSECEFYLFPKDIEEDRANEQRRDYSHH